MHLKSVTTLEREMVSIGDIPGLLWVVIMSTVFGTTNFGALSSPRIPPAIMGYLSGDGSVNGRS